jgi:hypothetical protein
MPLDGNPFKRFGRWVRDQIIQDVPEGTAVCELDCRKEQCEMGEWEGCERRLNKAAGELMPTGEVRSADHEAIQRELKEGTMGGEPGARDTVGKATLLREWRA